MTFNEKFLTLYKEFDEMIALAYPDFDQSKGAIYYYQNKLCPSDRKAYIDALRKEYNALQSAPLTGASGSKCISADVISLLLTQIKYLVDQVPELRELFKDTLAVSEIFSTTKTGKGSKK